MRRDIHLPVNKLVLVLEVTMPDTSTMALSRPALYTWTSMANKLHAYQGCVNVTYTCTNAIPLRALDA